MAQNYDSAGRGESGLINMGNTCYLNSVFQCLAHTDPLRHYFIAQPIEELLNLDRDGWTAFYFAIYIRQLWSDKFSSLRIISLKKKLGQLNPEFSGTAQCDAYELLTCLLENIHDDIKKYKFDLNVSGQNIDNVYAGAAIAWANFASQNDSPIVDNFYHLMVKTIVCGNGNCRKPRYRYETQPIASVDVIEASGRLPLVNLLGDFAATKDSEVPLTCDLCGQQTFSTMTDMFWSLPKILVILLKRIEYTNTGQLKKIQTIVDYPITDLNMADYCHPGNREPISKVYDLYAVVKHKGEAKVGHYQAVAKTSHGTKGRGWCNYNDNIVERYQPVWAISKEAYILFYRRRDS